jgi:uncharacterized protein (UPF0333 family)
MFKREYLISYIKWGVIAAIAFCIPMVIFVNSAQYEKSWLLYLGNVLFLVVIAAYMLSFNKSRGENASTQAMNAAGHIATVVGIIISCIVGLIVLSAAGVLGGNNVMEDAPAQTGTGASHGKVFFVFMNAIIGNLAGGSFASIILPYSARKNQTKDRRSEVLNN